MVRRSTQPQDPAVSIAELGRLQDAVKSLAASLEETSWPDLYIEAQTGGSRIAVRFSHLPAPDTREIRIAKGGLKALDALGSTLQLREKVPNQSEVATVGALLQRIHREDPEFAALVSNANPKIVFKDEEGTGADRMMTAKLKAGLDALAALVESEWPGVKLRVTEAWDENGEHDPSSLHYEGRAADLTTSPLDGAKLGRLGRLAVDAGLSWVFFEDTAHIHVSSVR